MNRSVTAILGVLLPLCLSAVAQPTGMFNYPALGGLHSSRAIWDITGTYTISLLIEGLGQLSFDLPVVQDVKGKLTGPGVIPLKAGTNDLICIAKVRGSAAGPSHDFNATIAVSLSGTGPLEGQVRKFKGSLTLTLKVDPNTVHLVGSLSGNATVSGVGSGSTVEPIAFPLPPGMMGSWSLALNLAPSGTKLAGDATITLSNGRTVPCTLSGSYSTKDGRTILKLSGTGTASGAKLGVNTTGIPPILDKVSGSVLGVSIN